ncbi:MAG: recombination regulator RecX [Burkholderiales bacterium]
MRKRKKPSLRERALRMLARREHSRLELQRKLAPHSGEGDDLEALLKDLEQRGWLSERRVVEQVVQTRRGKYGSYRIAQKLREKGIPDELIFEALPALRKSEYEDAQMLLKKKFGAPPADNRELAKQIRFMQGRGFSLEVILKVLRQKNGL